MKSSDQFFHENEDNELLSAYLDGELDEAERLQVEQRLQQDPEARELLSQLQSASESVACLPKHGLGSDLREEILSRAIVERREDLPEVSTYRRWVYAAAAIAAALLLSIYQPQQDEDDQRVASMVRPSKPSLEGELNERTGEQRALGSFGGLWGGQESSFSDFLDLALSKAIAQPSHTETLEEQIGDAALEDFHIHLQSSVDKPGLNEFKKILTDTGVIFLDSQNDVDQQHPSKAEVILLEVPMLQLQRIVIGCGQLEGMWKSAQIRRPDNSVPSIFFLADSESEVEQADAAARLALADSLGDERNAARGWALHLNRERWQAELIDDIGSRQAARGQGAIRVLFVLHPAGK